MADTVAAEVTAVEVEEATVEEDMVVDTESRLVRSLVHTSNSLWLTVDI